MEYKNVRSVCQQDFEPTCPKCGTVCDHTPEEMTYFGLEAAEEACQWLERISKE